MLLLIAALALLAHAGDCALLLWWRGNVRGFPPRLIFLVALFDFTVALVGLAAIGALWTQ